MARFGNVVMVTAILVVQAGCRQQMASQPSYRPFTRSTFFADQRSARPLVPGTIARGHLQDDPVFFLGEAKQGNKWIPSGIAVGLSGLNPFAAISLMRVSQPTVDALPLKEILTRLRKTSLPKDEQMMAVLQHGQLQFNIFCAVCHDYTGNGNGMIVQRGYAKPPSFHLPRLRQAPLGHLFQVATNGYGAMPSYASQIPPENRWSIAAYVRALQLSQHATLDDVRRLMQRGDFATDEQRMPTDMYQRLQKGGMQP